MIRTAACLLVLATSACTDADKELLGLGSPDGSGVPDGHEPPVLVGGLSPTNADCGRRCAVAVLGSDVLEIDPVGNTNTLVRATGAWQLERRGGVVGAHYDVIATALRSDASMLELLNVPSALRDDELLVARYVRTVTVIPAAPYRAATGALAYAPGLGDFAIALGGDQTELSASGRLVDASLEVESSAVTIEAWDRFALAIGTEGPLALSVRADSFVPRTLTVDVVPSIDRITPTVTGDEVCFHAYRGTREVYAELTIVGDHGPLREVGANNCRAVDRGTHRITGLGGGVATEIDVTIP